MYKSFTRSDMFLILTDTEFTVKIKHSGYVGYNTVIMFLYEEYTKRNLPFSINAARYLRGKNIDRSYWDLYIAPHIDSNIDKKYSNCIFRILNKL